MNLKKNKKGQATVEAILLITIFLGVSSTISQAFQKNNYFAEIIEGPWDFVDGMIRDGVWMKSSKSLPFNTVARVRHGSKTTNPANIDQTFNANETNLQ